MSDKFDQFGGDNDDLDRRLRAAAGSADDPMTGARIRYRVAASIEASGQLRGTSWHPRLLAAFAVLVPAVAAAAIAGIVLFGHSRNVGVVQVPGGGSPSAQPSPLPPTPTTAPVESSPSPVSLTGFQPYAMSALSETHFWVLGCPAGATRLTLVSTTDGGGHFTPDGLVPAIANACVAGTDLRFADPTNAWIFRPGLWATHDGARSWNAVAVGGDVLQLEPGAQGMVYAVVAQSTGASNSQQVLRTSAKADQWAPVAIPGGISGLATIAVHGTSLWVMVSGQNSALWVSRDLGSTFVRYADPCSADLGGSLSPQPTP